VDVVGREGWLAEVVGRKAGDERCQGIEGAGLFAAEQQGFAAGKDIILGTKTCIPNSS